MARYVKSRGLLPVAMEAARVFEQAQSTLRAAQDEFEGRAHAGAARREARRLLEQQLASHYPNAYQCGGCGSDTQPTGALEGGRAVCCWRLSGTGKI